MFTSVTNLTGKPCHIIAPDDGYVIATIEPGQHMLQPYYAADHAEFSSDVEVDGELVPVYGSDLDWKAHNQYRIDLQLPDYDEDTLVLVPAWAISALVREGMDDRDDIVVAHGVTRDKDTGRVLGCKGLRFVFPEYEPDPKFDY